MNDDCNSWQEQDIFYEWARKYNYSDIPRKDFLKLINSYTSLRIEKDKEIAQLKQQNADYKAKCEKLDGLIEQCRAEYNKKRKPAEYSKKRKSKEDTNQLELF